ncbi:hypothetical protein [Acetobacterium woodii]|uniref:hypothetical protein n=1 Tax=Acetobacterium woodii TaxID=33952 RepID=UPI0005A22B3D|nr:hypothetical protein [Acetobacterium woodii]
MKIAMIQYCILAVLITFADVYLIKMIIKEVLPGIKKRAKTVNALRVKTAGYIGILIMLGISLLSYWISFIIYFDRVYL